jgi:hypothetical protein
MADGGMMVRRFRALLATPRGLLILGLVIREALSFWTGHPYDTEVWIRNAFFVSQGANPYSALMPAIPGLSFAYLHEDLPGVGYLPVWPLIVAGLYKVYTLLPFSRFFLYFLLKQPTVLADAGLGVLIYQSVQRWGGAREASLKAMRYWAFFPYAIVISAIWGQFDALVVVLLMLSLLAASSGRRVIWVGTGIALKWFPLIFLPFLTIRERWPRNFLPVLSLAIPSIVSLAIFWIFGWDLVGVTAMSISASHGSGIGMSYVNILQAPLLVAALERIPFFYETLGYLWVPGILVAALLARRRFQSDPQGIVQAILLLTAVFYLTRYGVNEQYMLYMLPFFLIDLTLWHPERRPLFRLLLSLATVYLLVNNDLLVRFLGPVSTSFVDAAYAADISSTVGTVRTAAIYALNVLLSVTFLQLALVFANPTRDARPWPRVVLERGRAWIGRRAAEFIVNPGGLRP